MNILRRHSNDTAGDHCLNFTERLALITARVVQVSSTLVVLSIISGPLQLTLMPQDALAQCPAEPALLSYDAGGTNPCFCLVQGEQAGVVFNPPAADFPLEILKVSIYWGSQFGGAPSQTEQAIHIYNAGLPNPGAPIFTLPGPTFIDGQLNTFNLEPLPGSIVVSQGPIAVTLEILNQSAGNAFAPSVVDDQNGCQGAGRNLVFASNQWLDACTQGVNGDWVFELEYRPCTPPVQVDPGTWGTIKGLYR